MNGITEELQTALRWRAPLAKPVPFREVRLKSGAPKPNACHENVDQWVKENPRHRAIRGWLVTSGFIFDRHSLIADERGEWFDITPIQPYRPPFLIHLGNEEEFMALPAQIILEPTAAS